MYLVLLLDCLKNPCPPVVTLFCLVLELSLRGSCWQSLVFYLVFVLVASTASYYFYRLMIKPKPQIVFRISEQYRPQMELNKAMIKYEK